MPTDRLLDEIQRLKAQRRAIILAHNYQRPEIQDLADYVGDSLGLSRMAAQTDAETIVFCGVHFMAETAKILSPEKIVLLPEPEAGCSLAATVTAEEVERWRQEHPDGMVVSYVNTTAAVKAVSDYCCTSGNALQVIQAIPREREILFLPDMFLGSYLEAVTGRSLELWLGECHVHAQMSLDDIEARWAEHPEAELLVHPECGCTTALMHHLSHGNLPPERTHLLSTEGMIRYIEQSPAREFLIATETGVLHRMQQVAGNKTALPLSHEAVCPYMKMTTLESVYRSLAEGIHEIAVPEEVAAKARRAIERMLQIA